MRVSGSQAFAGMKSLIPSASPLPRQAQFLRLSDPRDNHLIDQGVVLCFPGPASFTGEDVVEYQIHGGMAVIRDLLQVLGALPGHRLAEAGEFTRRAFENGKMDLTAAEGIADLIHAETEAQKAQALSQIGGALSDLYEGWGARLKRIMAHLEADIDFPDEDLPEGVLASARPALTGLLQELREHLDDNRRGERLRDGVQVVVIGAPNVGKSSLVNALAQRDVAIVSEHAGTTRDLIETHLNIGGFPVILVDTAGLRPEEIGSDGQEGIESEGIRRALQRAEAADIRVLVFDALSLPSLDCHTLRLLDQNSLVVFNKTDAPCSDIPVIAKGRQVEVSVKTGRGLEQFIAMLGQMIASLIGNRETPSLTRVRHRTALEECASALARGLGAALPELMAEDVRMALRALGRITGRVDVEDVLDVIFHDFCIGK